MLSDKKLRVGILSSPLMSVFMLSVVMLSVVMLSVMAATSPFLFRQGIVSLKYANRRLIETLIFKNFFSPLLLLYFV
jgi:hypothetical protein